MHYNSELLFKKYAADLFENNMRVLEIGPQGRPSAYEKAVNKSAVTWETLDLFSFERVTYVAATEYAFPVPDSTFDIVFSGQVVEHVRKIWVWIKELSRVCKPGGLVITINPVNWPYHEAPHDCWRIYPEGMRALYEECGLEVVLTRKESLDRCAGPLCSIKRFVCGSRGWQDWMAEDVITIGKKA